jgi:hypothetical protein
VSPVRPNGKRIELETLGDVVKMLNPKEVRRRGVEARIFTENGLLISAVAAGLRTRGYEVEVFEQGGVRRLRLVASPGAAAKRRAADQAQLFDLPPTGRRGPYEDAA